MVSSSQANLFISSLVKNEYSSVPSWLQSRAGIAGAKTEKNIVMAAVPGEESWPGADSAAPMVKDGLEWELVFVYKT